VTGNGQGGNMENTVVLAVGDTFHLKMGKDRITYAGMPSEDVYSIVQRKTDGYRGFAWNLYYSRRKAEITIDGVGLMIESVSPDEIIFRIH
jgi:hypothetical protein